MLKVGITGGIGAGKSIISKLFQLYNIKVYNADYFAKYLMQNDLELIKRIKAVFGVNVYTDRKLNRKKLAEIVFGDITKLQQLNSLVHPAVAKHSIIWMKQQSGPYVLKEAALLFETSSHKSLDCTILVSAPEKIRIARVMKRDNTDAESVKLRIGKQLKDNEKMAFADFVIINDGILPIIPQVIKIHQKLLKKSIAKV